MLRAIVFDFDGLMLGTEMPEYLSWCHIYELHQQVLPLTEWVTGVGTRGGFDPYAHLEQLVGRPIDRAAVRGERRTRYDALRLGMPLLDGVESCINAARSAGLQLAIASSSDEDWVLGHMEPFGIAGLFDAIVCASDAGLPAKPDPAVYLAALERLGVSAPESLAFEDSPNGIAAAKAAGMRCIAVPNEITAALDFSAADQVVASLALVSIPGLTASWDPWA